MNLFERVRHHYLEHLEQLPKEKRFHFVSRLSAWSKDPECLTILSKELVELTSPGENIVEVLKGLINSPVEAHINALSLRQPYFDKYPKIRGIGVALFRVRHLLFIYNQDVRKDFLSIVSLEELHSISKKLAADGDALRHLSTYAINYLYLVERILYPSDTDPIDTSTILKLRKDYDLSSLEEIQLLIYLYMHCIIGESNFYTRKVTEPSNKDYLTMLQTLEPIINQNFDYIHLDNKLEFLVCCKICDYRTELEARIFKECEQSISPEGDFLIDTVNHFKQIEKTSFIDSEHRNVLFIMASSDFKL